MVTQNYWTYLEHRRRQGIIRKEHRIPFIHQDLRISECLPSAVLYTRCTFYTIFSNVHHHLGILVMTNTNSFHSGQPGIKLDVASCRLGRADTILIIPYSRYPHSLLKLFKRTLCFFCSRYNHHGWSCVRTPCQL